MELSLYEKIERLEKIIKAYQEAIVNIETKVQTLLIQVELIERKTKDAET